jgi:Flp pilus assembly protein TadG
MKSIRKVVSRRGIILPLVAVSLVALVGMVALAVDIGRLATAQTQCQDAADAAAIAGARSLDGTQDLTGATSDAVAAATSCKVLGVALTSTEVSVSHGAYHYSTSSQTFSPQIPAVAPDDYNLTQATVTHTVSTTFGRILGKTSSTVTATATAAHRPRDIAIILDYSGSMNNESDLWNNETYLGSVNNSPNNTDTVVPQWGQYSSSGATLICTSSDPRVGMCNNTHSVLGIPPMVNDFYANGRGSSAQGGFTSQSYTNLYTPPAGDKWLAKSGTSTTPPTYATTIQDVTGATSTQISNKTDAVMTKYKSKNGSYYGYTLGPGYWGKTFFLWPPAGSSTSSDTNLTVNGATQNADWRLAFFTGNTTSSVADNTKMWDSSGNWQDPSSSTYAINYAAILRWIKYCGANPFPSELRAGNVLYYSSIPDDVPSSAYTWTNANDQITNQDQRFWKEYIDFVLGEWRDPFGNVQNPDNPSCSYGPDFTWGTVHISAPVTGYKTSPTTRMHPQDNPQRPRHRFWFGPMTMIQYMSDTGILPGTTHDISMVCAKLGVDGALQDIQNNHPNDLVSLVMFSRPNYSGEPTEAGQFPIAQVALTNNYSSLINALWYPPNSGSADVRPWDTNGLQTPSAHGDYNSNTSTDYGFMLAYNQLSTNSSLVAGGNGGLGRKGAQKIVILETDGMANQATSASFTNAGAYKSYYNVGTMGSYSTSGNDPASSAETVATNICALSSASTPGYAESTRPVQVNTLAFGAIFEPTASGSEQSSAVAFLQALSNIGGTTFPSSSSDATNGYKWCIGTLSDRQTKLQTAFTKILDQTESIILVK